MTNIEHLSHIMLAEINQQASNVLSQLHQRCDDIIDSIHADHDAWMHRMDQADIAKAIADIIYPHESVAAWFQAQPVGEREHWHGLYHEYQYGPNGDGVFAENNYFAEAVMTYLRSVDTYLQKPFCGYCDSRGHRDGACMIDIDPAQTDGFGILAYNPLDDDEIYGPFAISAIDELSDWYFRELDSNDRQSIMFCVTRYDRKTFTWHCLTRDLESFDELADFLMTFALNRPTPA